MSRWLENETKLTSIFAIISVISLILSITGVLHTILPVDAAWIAIILCGVPILVGAVKGLVFEHDIRRVPYLLSLTKRIMKKVVVNAALLLRYRDE